MSAAARVRVARERLRGRGAVVLRTATGEAVRVIAAQFAAAAPPPIRDLGARGPVGLVLPERRWDDLGVPAGGRRPRALGLAAVAGLGDRATRVVSTIAAALDSATRAGEIAGGDAVRPHGVAPGGVRARSGTAEAALELVRGAGLLPAAVVVPADPGEGAGAGTVSVDDVAEVAWAEPGAAVAGSRVLMPSEWGTLTVLGVETPDDGGEHVALWAPGGEPPSRVTAEVPCWAGHAFGGVGCGCGDRMRAALEDAAAGRVLLVHVGHPRGAGARDPGRGCGVLDARARGIAAAVAGLAATSAEAREVPVDHPRLTLAG